MHPSLSSSDNHPCAVPTIHLFSPPRCPHLDLKQAPVPKTLPLFQSTCFLASHLPQLLTYHGTLLPGGRWNPA